MQGMGITSLRTFIVEDTLKGGRLEAVLQPYCPKPFGLYAVMPSRQFTPARVRLLVEYLSDRLPVGFSM